MKNPWPVVVLLGGVVLIGLLLWISQSEIGGEDTSLPERGEFPTEAFLEDPEGLTPGIYTLTFRRESVLAEDPEEGAVMVVTTESERQLPLIVPPRLVTGLLDAEDWQERDILWNGETLLLLEVL